MPSQENEQVSEPVVSAEGAAEFLEASMIMETTVAILSGGWAAGGEGGHILDCTGRYTLRCVAAIVNIWLYRHFNQG